MKNFAKNLKIKNNYFLRGGTGGGFGEADFLKGCEKGFGVDLGTLLGLGFDGLGVGLLF